MQHARRRECAGRTILRKPRGADSCRSLETRKDVQLTPYPPDPRPLSHTGHPLSRRPVLALAGLLLAISGDLRAQDNDDLPLDTAVPTLERVEALRPEQEALDLYRFDNPIDVEPNRFDEVYDPPPSPEEVALEHGGYINYGIKLGLQKTWSGIKKMTGMRDDTQSAIARPPPLSDEQMRRAAAVCGTDGVACPGAQ